MRVEFQERFSEGPGHASLLAREAAREAVDAVVACGGDGTFHEVDSSELAFKMAGIFALKDAAKKANVILLEPIMKVEVTTPDEYQGDLLGDINRRRGIIKF